MKINHLTISWSISRGRDTYGYNICRLDSRQSGKRYKTTGGGYDMIGTVFGDWLESEYQRELVELVAGLPLVDCGYTVAGYKRVKEDINPRFYGLTVKPDGSVSLDGACGHSCMVRIAEAIGLEVQWEGNKKGHTIGYFVAPKELEAA
jgi:hypothetical protein